MAGQADAPGNPREQRRQGGTEGMRQDVGRVEGLFAQRAHDGAQGAAGRRERQDAVGDGTQSPQGRESRLGQHGQFGAGVVFAQGLQRRQGHDDVPEPIDPADEQAGAGWSGSVHHV